VGVPPFLPCEDDSYVVMGEDHDKAGVEMHRMNVSAEKALIVWSSFTNGFAESSSHRGFCQLLFGFDIVKIAVYNPCNFRRLYFVVKSMGDRSSESFGLFIFLKGISNRLLSEETWT